MRVGNPIHHQGCSDPLHSVVHIPLPKGHSALSGWVGEGRRLGLPVIQVKPTGYGGRRSALINALFVFQLRRVRVATLGVAALRPISG